MIGSKIFRYILIFVYIAICCIPLGFISISASIALEDFVEPEVTIALVLGGELLIAILIFKSVSLDRYKLMLIAFVLYEVFFLSSGYLLKDLEYMSIPDYDDMSLVFKILYSVAFPIILLGIFINNFLYMVKIILPYLIVINLFFIAVTVLMSVRKGLRKGK